MEEKFLNFTVITLFFIFLNTTLLSQSFESQDRIKEEAYKRKLSQIKSCVQKEFGYSFGKRNEVGEKVEYTEYNKNGFELISKFYYKGFTKNYSESEYDNKNNLITFSEYDSRNNLISKRINKYDNNLLHTESVNFNGFGTIEYKQYFEYNSNKKIVGGATFYYNGDLYSKWQFKYEGNNLKEEIFYDSEGKISSKSIYVYSNNKKIKETHLKSDGAKLREIIFEYPTNNKIVETTSYYILADPIVTKTFSIIDKDRKIIEKYLEKEDGLINWRILYTYDGSGNPSEEIHYNSLDEPEKSIVYEYDYY